MVAREGLTGDGGGRGAAWFAWWRRRLTAVSRLVARLPAVLRPAGRGVALLARFVEHPATAAADDHERRALAGAGLFSLLAGIVLSLVLAPALGITRPEAAFAVVWTLLWAAIRLLVLALALPGLGRARLGRAWAAALLPAIVGVTDPLRVLAFAASAWLTFGALRNEGVHRRRAMRATSWAFGAQFAGAAVRWLSSGFLLYLSARR